MSDDGYPNFGNAWTATAAPPSSSASWNPALRPDTNDSLSRGHAVDVPTASHDDFFDRYHEEPHHEASLPDVEPDDTASLFAAHRHSISVERSVEQRSEAASPEQLMRVPATEWVAEGPGSRRQSAVNFDEQIAAIPLQSQDDEEEGAVFQPGESIEEQETELELRMPDHEEPLAEMENKPAATEAHSREEPERPGSGYEHQGETLEMEEAVEEAPSVPLLNDPEEPPTVETMQPQAPPPPMRAVGQGSMLDFDGSAISGQPLSKTAAQPGQLNRSFTTNFTELQTPVKADKHEVRQEPACISEGWPSAGDKTFGELLGNEEPSSQTKQPSDELQQTDDSWGPTADDDAFGEMLGQDSTGGIGERSTRQSVEDALHEASVVATETAKEEDLAAMWASALDDDDLLDESKDLDPSSFFGDDDPGFLDDEILTPADAALAPVVKPQAPVQTQRTISSYLPSQPGPQAGPYAAANAQASSSHGRSAGTPSTGLYDVYGHGAPAQPQAQTQRPSMLSAQSFVDKAKGGYQSPYDLPMEVVKTKQRPRPAPIASQAAATPPPRSSSMSSQSGQQLHSLPPMTSIPQSSVGSIPAPLPPTAVSGVPSARGTPTSDSGFFADLPVSGPKPRARPSGAYTPQPQVAPTPPPSQMPRQLGRPPTAPPAPSQQSVAPPTLSQRSSYAGLAQPERLPLLPNQISASAQSDPHAAPPQNQRYSPSSLPTPTQAQNRFSPAPPSSQVAPAASRYSPAPASQVVASKKYGPAPSAASNSTGVQSAHQFLPRTSSPLAYHTEKSQPLPSNELPHGAPPMPASPPKTNGTRSPGIISPERAVSISYPPVEQRVPSGSNLTSPPQRPMTQSPPAVMKTSKYASVQPLERPASASGMVPTPVTAPSHPVPSSTMSPSNRLHHRRQFSRDLGFTAPQDERAHDSLERWKGHPILRWSDSGVIVSSFPRHTPFYAAGHGIPSVKCTPGAVSTQQAPSFMAMDDRNAKFPGPLPARAKGKKKEVAAWMAGKIEDLERKAELARMDFQMDPDLKKRTEEKLVLWKIVKIFVDHDSHLEGTKQIEAEIRAVLLPSLAQANQVMEQQSPVPGTHGIQADTVDKTVVIQLRQALLEGDRERAVWLAEEKKLWGHAMLIASTMGPEVWKQIIQSFVRSQVKTVGSDARSLAALYQVFAGNADECVDELVPPSARAGFQMVSKTDGSVSGNPLEGLDQWRDTLGLIAGNRTPNDAPSLVALGKLLSTYGRAEAAHTCFLFARQLAKHTGADDAEVSFVTLGANHLSTSNSFANDLDAIILTEIYEWASSLSAPSGSMQYIPHLQSFKLIHAQELAAYGLKAKAQSYCDHITSAFTSTTRPSPYYHPTFTAAVGDLGAFLSQSPQTGKSGLLSKGAMNKVSSGASSWFTKFVSGDDDQTPPGSAPGAGSQDMISGPFGGVGGDLSDNSNSGSGQDLYDRQMKGDSAPFAAATPPQQQFAPTSAPSKYAPAAAGNRYAPGSAGSASSFGISPHRATSPLSRSSMERPSSSYSSKSYYAPNPAVHALSLPRPDAGRVASDYSVSYSSDSRRGSAQLPGSQGRHEPKPLLAEENPSYGGQQPVHDTEYADPCAEPNGVEATETSMPNPEDGGYQPHTSSYEPSSIGYEPHSGGYEPPAYQPYRPDAEEPEVSAKSKKRNMMDDDEDDAVLNAADAARRAEADRQADEAFRKAAEADAARDKTKGAAGDKKGWFGGIGGLFGGKKESQDMPTVHKAKLGEENSFYFDKDLNKWVNKKGGADAATPAAVTPPPPRGPPSRAVSAVQAMGPPSGPPSRVASGAGIAGTGGSRGPPSMSGSIGGSPSLGPPSGPPSRVGTPASGDGVPMPAAVAALYGSDARSTSAPPSRPSTSMSNASSLDDLLGQPAQRKAGGTVKGKKKTQRYVDVMAK